MFLRLIKPSKNSSFFLFGARGTGKSTFLRLQFEMKNPWFIDLLDPLEEDRFIKNPMVLETTLQSMKPRPDWVVIDEVQRVPKLLNVVHRLIENEKQKFILTGSSARKLKRGQANLLAGRAFLYHCHPLTSIELGKSFDLIQCLQYGQLPKLFSFNNHEDKRSYLKSYSLIYLKEEVQAEQLVRKIDPFRNFLEVAAQSSGKILNYANISRDVGVDLKTVQKYYQILEETWIGIYLPAFHRSIRKSQKTHPKFYFFDLGIKKILTGEIDSLPTPQTSSFGHDFEAFVLLEILRLNDYYQKDFKFSYYQTKNDVEIDLVLSKGKKIILIEIKSNQKVDPLEVQSFSKLSEDFGDKIECYYLSRDMREQKVKNVNCLSWDQFLHRFNNIS